MLFHRLVSFFGMLLPSPLVAVASNDIILCPGFARHDICTSKQISSTGQYYFNCSGYPEWCGCQKAEGCRDNVNFGVLCPDQPHENYCNCDGDCTDQPERCGCRAAQECCKGVDDDDDDDDYDDDFRYGGEARYPVTWFRRLDNIVLCPGQTESNYCDCYPFSHCADHLNDPHWCGCQEARDCCENDDRAVLCPPLKTHAYCNAQRCTEHPHVCQCQEAQEFCQRKQQEQQQQDAHGTREEKTQAVMGCSSMVVMAVVIAGVAGVVVVVVVHYRMRRCRGNPKKGLFSKTTTATTKPSEKQDEKDFRDNSVAATDVSEAGHEDVNGA